MASCKIPYSGAEVTILLGKAETIDDKIDKTDITQVLGTATDKIPSEKAVSDAIAGGTPGSGDMLKSVYDPTNQAKDIFAEINGVDDKVKAINKVFENITLQPSEFVADTTYVDYPFKADITATGIDNSYYADIVFSLADAINGNLAPVNLTDTNKITIYAKVQPTSNVVVDSIFCSKVVV